nr:MAG: hypothetical protein [uncultured archaeon]
MSEENEEKNYRIELPISGRHYLNSFFDDLENNLYYNQIWVWCEKCGRRHNTNSDIAWEHFVKPIPIKCKVDEDHCWRNLFKQFARNKKFIIIELYLLSDGKDTMIWLSEGYTRKCIICGKKGLDLGITVEPFISLKKREEYGNLTTTQLKEIIKYIQSIKDLGFKKLNEMTGNQFKGEDIVFRMIELSKKLREIQNIEDYLIIGDKRY